MCSLPASFLIIIQLVFAGGRELTDTKCDSPLGMESNRISDGDLTASSSYVSSVNPVHARVRVDKGGGAWCPSNPIRAGVKEWLEVNLKTPQLISGVETQGRYGKGQGQEFAEAFKIEYWRDSVQDWIEYKNATGGNLLSGNANPWHSVKQSLDNPFVASKVRFIPHSVHPRTVCMRVELYGCDWSTGLTSYELDTTVQKSGYYDGVFESGRLVKGLGVLTDGVIDSEESLPEAEDEGQSSRWVTWETGKGSNASILFRFGGFREFSSIALHLASGNGFSFPSSVSVTGMGRTFLTDVKPSDEDEDTEAMIVISIDGLVSDNLRIDLILGGQSLALTEIGFDSENYTGDVNRLLSTAQETTRQTTQPTTTMTSTSTIKIQRTFSTDESVQMVSEDYRTYIAILAAVLTIGVVLTMVLFIWLVVKCFQGKKDGANHKGCWDKWCKRRTVQPSSELYGFARMSGESDSDTSSTLYHEPYRVTAVPVKSQTVQDEIEGLMRRDCGLMLTPRSFQTQSSRSVTSPGMSRYPFQPISQTPGVYSPYTTPTKMISEKHYASSNILKVYEPTTCANDGNYTLTSGRYS